MECLAIVKKALNALIINAHLWHKKLKIK
jgi:hypothetical protein